MTRVFPRPEAGGAPSVKAGAAASVRLISIVGNMHGGAGHHFPYHEAVGRAARLNGWTHEAACPAEDARAGLPPNWNPCLYKKALYVPLGSALWWLPVKAAMKLYGMARFGWAIAGYLRRTLRTPGSTVLFVDDLGVPQMIALAVSLPFVPRKGLRAWILYRTRIYDKRLRAGTFAVLHKLIRLELGRDSVQLLTDSSALSESLAACLHEPLFVMPIPHLERFAPSSAGKPGGEVIRCWWPGAPRPEKGLAEIKRLAGSVGDNARRLELVLSENAGVEAVVGGPRIAYVPDGMSREEYGRMMNEADVILLPYTPSEYGERTSGIFVECVAAGKIPVVTDRTWMARELRRHGLASLILDWNHPSTGAAIARVATDGDVRKRLAEMRRAYLAMHGERAFSRVMAQLLHRATPSSVAGAPRPLK